MAASGAPDAERLVAAELVLAGVTATVVLVGLSLPPKGESSEWLLYVLLGATTPVAVLGLAHGRVPPAFQVALAWAGAVVAVGYVVATARWVPALFGLAQGVLTALLTRRRSRSIELGVAVLAWAAVVTIGRNADPVFDSLERYLVAGAGALALTAGGFLLVVGSFALCERRFGSIPDVLRPPQRCAPGLIPWASTPETRSPIAT